MNGSVMAGVALLAVAAPAGKPPVEIGARLEPFVDDWLIEKMQGASLQLQHPERREVVFVADQPWEGPGSAYYTVVQDGERICLYYRGFVPKDDDPRQVTCMAESTDGIHFTRPALRLFEFNGSKENNIVWVGKESHNFAPFVDRNPRCKPEERYKAIGGLPPAAFASPDGVHWRKIQDAPVITRGAFDSLNVAFWDEAAGRYRCFSRYFDHGKRAIQSATSGDFLHWTEPVPHQYAPGVPLEHFYTNATVPCPGAPHILLSFPKRFVPERQKVAAHPDTGVSDAVFLSSRDGVHWDRTFLEAWLRPGLDQRNWTQRSNMPAWGIAQTGPEELSLYVSEHYSWPDNRLRRVTVQPGRFASVHAGAEGGEVVTRPLLVAGRRLVLNYATSAAGSVQVEVQDTDGRPLPGHALTDMPPLYGDELAAVVTWKAGPNLPDLAGKPIRLRFVVRDADVYAVRFGE